MPRQRSAVQLRKEARKLMTRARRIENRQCEKLGRLVQKYHRRDYTGFDLDAFKEQVSTILEHKRT